MSERSITHGTFVLERIYNASPTRVFAAWANPAAKARWFAGPDEGGAKYELDFRVGGPPGGPVYT
ncbi:MAG: polyketide cyclase, partial [Chloroflexota bacterium]